MEHIQIIKALKKKVHLILKSPTVRSISGLAGGNVLSLIFGMIGSLVQARFVSPDDMGYFRQFSIATGYIFLINLGVFEAVQRLYPLYIGKNQKNKAIEIVEIGQSWNIIISFLISGIFLILSVVSLLHGNWRASLGWLAQAVSMTLFFYGGYLNATYRSGHDFTTLAKSSVTSSIITLTFLPLVYFWPYIGLVVRSSVGRIFNIIYLHFNRPLKIQWRFNWRETFFLIKQGFPIFLSGYIGTTFWSVTESAIILSQLGTTNLGLWSITVMVIEMANKIPQSFVSVFKPRVIELFGKTNSASECLSYIKKPIFFGILTSLFIIILGWISLPIIIPILMPKYTQAIMPISIYLFLLPLMIFELPNSLLIAMDKRIQLNISVIIGLSIFILIALVGIRMGYGLNIIPIASIIGNVIKVALIFIFININRI